MRTYNDDSMRRLYIKQRMFAFGGEQFDVTDEDERPVYHVEGSFMRIPKSFTITDGNGFEVARIEKKTLSWLPHFSVIVDGVEIAGIDKEFSFFKPKYRIDAQGLRVEGDWVDLNFTVVRGDELVAEISQRWLSWGDSYEVIVHDDAMATIVVALVIAIDKVKADEESSGSAAAVSDSL
ncbi:LURP-one-related/scramblase family protein [Bifidobacterium pullorum]|uniref:LURP-one-related family protein n=1 Tax=Bifidobacterium pullorum subsp. gallinarum TaxID=78344 RepID=A0A921IYW2_9BIFI|nr:LURP-one-related family protein [Bifidobacterium pullorum]HJG41206.1 LURP-one-related family protein [Bifidobacterium pullorum subsp. gallinarum]